jgi:hypothetical protein
MSDAVCPRCDTPVGLRTDGTLYPHDRYADGAGPGPDVPHDMVPCEGGDNSPRRGVIHVTSEHPITGGHDGQGYVSGSELERVARTELAWRAAGYIAAPAPDDGQEHAIGQPCPACSVGLVQACGGCGAPAGVECHIDCETRWN